MLSTDVLAVKDWDEAYSFNTTKSSLLSWNSFYDFKKEEAVCSTYLFISHSYAILQFPLEKFKLFFIPCHFKHHFSDSKTGVDGWDYILVG